MPKFLVELSKFTIVGIINTALTTVIFLLLLRLFKINYLSALTCTWTFGILFSYVLNYLWVFKPEERIQFRDRFVKYSAANLLTFGLNFLALRYIVEHSGFDPFYVQITLIPAIFVINFSSSKFWSLRQWIYSLPTFVHCLIYYHYCPNVNLIKSIGFSKRVALKICKLGRGYCQLLVFSRWSQHRHKLRWWSRSESSRHSLWCRRKPCSWGDVFIHFKNNSIYHWQRYNSAMVNVGRVML